MLMQNSGGQTRCTVRDVKMANLKFMFIRGPFKLNISRNSATITIIKSSTDQEQKILSTAV